MSKINIREFALQVLHDEQAGRDHDACDLAYKVIWTTLSAQHREVLLQLCIKGPVYDGDIISKAARDDLIKWGLASRAVFKAQQGYAVANYTGWYVWQCDDDEAETQS